MDNLLQHNPIRMTLDELFKKVFPGLTHWIDKIQISKEENITAEKHPTGT